MLILRDLSKPIRAVLPGARILCCIFHLAQSWWRKINKKTRSRLQINTFLSIGVTGKSAQMYIVYYYYSKKKARGKMTSLPVTSLPVMTSLPITWLMSLTVTSLMSLTVTSLTSLPVTSFPVTWLLVTSFPKLWWPTGPQYSQVPIKPLTCLRHHHHHRRRNTHRVMMKNPIIFWKPIIRFCFVFGNLYTVMYFM